jgi:DNA polymerase-3 subunit beta
MKLRIESKTLLSLCARAKPVASGRASIAALNCVRLFAKGDELTITANDLDKYLEIIGPCVTEAEGAVLLNAARLLSAATALGGGELTMSADSKHFVTLSIGESQIKLAGLHSDEFPPAPAGEFGKPVEFPADVLRVKLAKVAPFASVDPTRYTLQGVAVSTEDSKAVLVATNGNALRVESLEVPSFGDHIIPSAAVDLLLLLCGESTAGVTLSFAENLFTARSGSWRVVGKLIEGKYPNWRMVLPSDREMTEEMRFDKDAMKRALRVADITADFSSGIGTLKFSGPALQVQSASKDGEGAVAGVTGGTATLSEPAAYKSALFRTLVDSFDGPEITVRSGHLAHGLVRDATGTAVIVPIRVK